MSSEADRFATARRNEAQLNRRQRQVLDLLTAGKTNGEIGDALGITLDGAKWNVSEILGKLGLDSREQAAEYWRWRNRTGGKLATLRGLLGIGTLKWVGGATAIVVGIAVVGALARNDDERSGALPPFYLEARIEVTDRSRSIGTDMAGSGLLAEEERISTIRWWNADRDHTRWEIENEDLFGPELTVLVSDGTDQWRYLETEGTYARQPMTPLPEEFRVRPFGISILIGPAYVSTVAEFLDALRGWGGDGATADRVGAERILGRDTVVYEFSPAAKSSSGRTDANGNLVETEQSEGSGRVWLDEERVVVMRYASTSATADIRAEVTRFDYGARVDPTRFRFNPPPGSVETDPSESSGGGGTGSSVSPGRTIDYSVPAGYFDVNGTPNGLVTFGWLKQEGRDSTVTKFEMSLARDDSGPVMTIQQRQPGALTEKLMEGKRLLVGESDAWLFRVGDQVRLTMVRDGTLIVITGRSVPESDVLAVAERLRRVE